MSKDKLNAVTKSVLSEKVLEAMPGSTLKRATGLVESVLGEIQACLTKGEIVKIAGFGNFVLHEKKARAGRNPRTGESITISDRRVMKFKISDKLKAELNGGTALDSTED